MYAKKNVIFSDESSSKKSVQQQPRHIFNGYYMGDVAEVAHVSIHKLANAPRATAASGIKAVVCLVSV